MSGARVRRATAADLDAWVAMRQALWPGSDAGELRGEAEAFLQDPRDMAAFVAEGDGKVVGLAEASLRCEYVNGTLTSPVGFLEAWYVAPEWRGQGAGRALVATVEDWTRGHGCSELASDALIDNLGSRAAHAACGFEGTGQVVYFRKPVR
ncbi:aminoglycoside 6'-N-acetyltransferase [Pseudoxanthomonas suwonensis]|uniref:aminoglycoside 6'-N-acetyltransferase n=1 Tax=Pseudoxanthomonas suwonensis TaxID=314722 RepID=UPI00049222A8|nr:aminoglycoside 6'-N-acetyltransferase [Pseudoxanthomonas suwonensis]